MGPCSYFTSEHWYDVVRRAVETWRLVDFVPSSGLVDDQWAFATRAASLYERDRAPTNDHRMTLGDVLDAPEIDLDVEREALVEAWVDRWGLPESCPHDAGSHEHCIYHRPPSETDSRVLRRRFLDDVEDDECHFVGARFGSLDLEGHRLVPDDATDVDCRYASFRELELRDATIGPRLDLSFARVSGPLDARGARFQGRVLLVGARLDGSTRFDHAQFESGGVVDRAQFGAPARLRFVSFGRGFEARGTVFEASADFHDATFGNGATFEAARFGEDARFRYARFEAGARFNDVLFGGRGDFHHLRCVRGALFRGAVFSSRANFRYAVFGSGTNYRTARFEGPADFYDVTFERSIKFGEAAFTGETTFERATFDRLARFDGTTFDGTVTFERASFTERSVFEETEFTREVTFERAVLHDVRFADVVSDHPVVFRGARLETGTIRHDSAVTATYDLTEATVGPVKLRFGGSNPFDAIGFCLTEFDGFDFSDHVHREHLAGGWRLHDPEAPASNQVLETTYLKAKNGASDVGDNRAASAFFLKEMAYRRKGYLDAPGTLPPAKGVVRWAGSWLLNVTAGYGERPLYTTASAVATILLFAVAFYAAGVRLPGPQEYLVVSLQSFVALVLGELPPSEIGPLRVLTSVEAFVGAFFIGLFVFSLTRSVHR